jgi:DNA-binding winged helix-turn-helix (wHTH) protein
MAVRFGRFVFDEGRRALLRDDASVELSPKAFQLLQLLLETRPRAVSKVDIHERLWPGTFVSDSSLTRIAAELRAALGDPARQSGLIRTVYGFGYAFAGEALEEAQAGLPRAAGRLVIRPGEQACRLVFSDRDIPLAEGENLIGRSSEGVVSIHAPDVSRRHARIFVRDGQATLEDLGSKNGTYLRGLRVQGAMPLGDGDEIRIGKVVLTFRQPSAPAPSEAETTG